MNKFNHLSIFCGSSSGKDTTYKKAARELATLLVSENIGIVYGGARLGLMGVLADEALKLGGEVIGVLPTFLKNKEVEHPHLSNTIYTQSMHERKLKMFELSDGFIAMPGGFGTLDELFEIITWSQLGLHQKPVGLLNTNNYFMPLLEMLDHMVKEGFLKLENRSSLLHHSNPEKLLNEMRSYEIKEVQKWIDLNQI